MHYTQEDKVAILRRHLPDKDAPEPHRCLSPVCKPASMTCRAVYAPDANTCSLPASKGLRFTLHLFRTLDNDLGGEPPFR
jgi:hypothetical protein